PGHPAVHSLPTRRSSDLHAQLPLEGYQVPLLDDLDPISGLFVGIRPERTAAAVRVLVDGEHVRPGGGVRSGGREGYGGGQCRDEDRKRTRLNSSHVKISY